ncbi:MAG: hypothetical protein Q4B48_04520 [Syntrophomonadaceae bacterium]|nr:hypothetical protein [Syntrophomonadaceae bacterium]
MQSAVPVPVQLPVSARQTAQRMFGLAGEQRAVQVQFSTVPVPWQ